MAEAKNVELRLALIKLMDKADDLIAAIDGTTDQFATETANLSAATTEADQLLERK